MLRSIFGRQTNRPATRVSDLPPLWESLLGAGVLDMALPESRGGGGAAISQLCITAEEAGRDAGSVGLVEHLVTTQFLGTLPSPAMLEWIPESTTASLALSPSSSGLWSNVISAPSMSAVIGVHGHDVIAVDFARSIDDGGNGPLLLHDVAVDQESCRILCPAELFDGALDTWRILTAAFLVGAADMVLARTVEYVTNRQQFGRQIGAYQGIQHGLSELPGMIEGARLLTAKAAWALAGCDTPPQNDLVHNDITDARILSAMAILFSAQTATSAVDRAIQYHGAIGAAAETGLHNFYQVVRTLPLLLGPLPFQRRRLARLLLEPTWTSP